MTAMKYIYNALKIGATVTIASTLLIVGTEQAFANGPAGSTTDQVSKFRQLGTELPSPNVYRSASGAPGPAYWQQQVDYNMDVTLDEDKKRIIASEVVQYTNNSPDTLRYLWVALDQNRFKDGSMARMSEIASAAGTRRDRAGSGDSYSFAALMRAQGFADQNHGFEFKLVGDGDGNPLEYTINDTMMRIELDPPLESGDSTSLRIDWEHNIIDEVNIGGRGGWEYFEEDDNYIFGLAQWFPRLASYTDYTGWQNKQFLGRGEFTLEFGDYEVNLTVPEDHIVSATGVLQNPRQVLTSKQRSRLDEANTKEPVFIVTPEEAAENEKTKATGTKTWKFKAENVRDFAWSSSRKYIWDAMLFEQNDEKNPVVTAMSFYPKEAEPIWSKYSTHAVVHTMDVYNKFSFNYPYPIAQSVNSWERGGMEYPMITFNGYRPTPGKDGKDPTYSRDTKYGLIGVIIHEIGHIYFPMVVNSDERRWTWMDEGLNTFLEYMAEYEWEENFPIRGGYQNPLDQITRYMQSSNQVPIMTQSDSVLQFGPNAYAKPAAALIVLRETVMGREQFDYAFREYSRRWKFKRPTPADFFRTMEDASAVDLDWFWRGWFFDTDYVDMGISSVREYRISSQDPEVEFDKDRTEDRDLYPENIVQRRNRDEGIEPYIERFPDTVDFYNENDKFTVSNKDRNKFKSFIDGLKNDEKVAYERAIKENPYIYFIDFDNHGGLISPLPLTLHYADGSTEELMIPAEIWRRDSTSVTKLIVRDKKIEKIDLDAAHQTADANFDNNSYPPVLRSSRLELFKSDRKRKDLMADMLVELKTDSDKDKAKGSDKMVPMTDGDTAEKKSSTSHGSDSKNTKDAKDAKDKDNMKKSLSEKDEKSLRRTLKRLLGQDKN